MFFLSNWELWIDLYHCVLHRKGEKVSMRAMVVIFAITILTVNFPQSQAWSYSVHEEVASRAIEIMPNDWKDFLKQNLAEIKDASVYPDEIKDSDPTEGPRHYDDSDILHQDLNVSSSSNDYSLGVVSWAADNFSKLLTTAIRERNGNDIVFYFGALSHYLADANQPFHATSNFDGQKTGNDGIHSRFETVLPNKYWDEILANVNTSQPKYIDSTYNATKEAIRTGLELVPKILEADNIAKTSEDYWATFYNLTKDIMIARISSSVQLVVDVWYSSIVKANATSMDIGEITFTTATKKTQSKTVLSSLSSTADDSYFSVSATIFAMGIILKRTKILVKNRKKH